jgi:hypothetical protein
MKHNLWRIDMNSLEVTATRNKKAFADALLNATKNLQPTFSVKFVDPFDEVTEINFTVYEVIKGYVDQAQL